MTRRFRVVGALLVANATACGTLIGLDEYERTHGGEPGQTPQPQDPDEPGQTPQPQDPLEPDEPSCPAGQVYCSGNCVDVAVDEQNCGECGRSCLGQPCQAALCEPITLATNQKGALGIAVTSGYVYWASRGAPAVMRIPTNGGTPELVSEADTFYLAATSSDVFWMDNNNIVRHQIGIGETILAADPFFPEFVMLYSQDVYWTSLDGTLRRVPQSGNGPSVIVYHTDDIWGPRAIARNDTGIFWVDGAYHGWLRSMSGDGGTVTALVETQDSYHGIAVDETHVYWTSSSLGEVYSMPVSGGLVTIMASDQAKPTRVLLDGEYVYWINDGGGQLHTGGGRVMKTHKAGGTPITLAIVNGVSDDGTDPSVTEEFLGDIAVDDTSVYWTVYEDTVGRVMKVAK